MKFPLFIALRYLFAKKSHNAINIISIITIVAVLIGTMALIVILSIFNGFDQLIQSMNNSFDPDIKITAVQGKTFNLDTCNIESLKSLQGIESISKTLEENALLKYEDKQHIATVKGVNNEYTNTSEIDTMMSGGEFLLRDERKNYTVIGRGIAYYLDIPDGTDIPIVIHIPKRSRRISVDHSKEFIKQPVFISGEFSIEQTKDVKYLFVSLDLLQNMLNYPEQVVSAIELKLYNPVNEKKIQRKIQDVLGASYEVKNKYQQNELFYKVMRIEKWAIAFILSFILFIASFNVLGSLTMLILDKKKDIAILRSLGANNDQIRKIFMGEGMLITLIGGISGLALGALLCFLQIHFEIIKLQGSGTFVIDAYPVYMKGFDFFMIFIIVSIIGFFASWYPVRYITKRYFSLTVEN